uniref:Histone H1-delta-like n=1 Tax=Saccoglossus kowalevskii TaxID=10224 RepID=A0ABM0LX09_SACKO|nr:PREDICTED: histone H1-delta-like [Saccoglossus kowalevskii]
MGYGLPTKKISAETGVSRQSLVNYCTCLREVCSTKLKNEDTEMTQKKDKKPKDKVKTKKPKFARSKKIKKAEKSPKPNAKKATTKKAITKKIPKKTAKPKKSVAKKVTKK